MKIDDFYLKNDKRVLVARETNSIAGHIAFHNVYKKSKITNLEVVSFKNLVISLYYDYLFSTNNNNQFIKIIDEREAVDIADNIIRDNELLNKQSFSYDSSKEFYSIYKELVLGKIHNDSLLPKAISNFITLYEEYCFKNNYIDLCSLIRYVSNNIPSSFYKRYDNTLYGFIDLKHYRYHEQKIISNFSLKDEILVDEPSVNLVFYKAYGLLNEIKNVVEVISDNKLPYGSVEVLYTDNAYTNIIKSVFECRNIPFTISSTLTSNDAVSFIINILEFASKNFAYLYLEKVVKNLSINNIDLFSQYAEYTSLINFGYEAYGVIDQLKHNILYCFINDLIEIFKNNTSFAQIISKLKYFCWKYINADSNKELIDTYIDNLSLTYEKYPKYIDYKRVINDLSNINVIGEDDRAKVKCIKYSKYQLFNRKNVFFVGLSNQQAKVMSNESPFIEDDTLFKILDNSYFYPTSRNKIETYNEQLKGTINSSKDSNIYISYSYFDTVDLKDMSPSSVYLELLGNKKQHEANLYGIQKNNLIINKRLVEDNIEISKNYLSKIVRLSPSSLEKLDSCPLSYIYSNIFKLPELQFREETSVNWLEGNQKGLFAHKILQNYANKFWKSKNISDFDQKCFEEVFLEVSREFESKIPCSDKKRREQEEAEIHEVLLAYVEEEQNKLRVSDYRVLFTELNFSNIGSKFILKDALDESKSFEVNISGSIDRVDYVKNPDGTFHVLIKDYKTGNSTLDNKFQPELYSFGIKEFIREKFGIPQDKIFVDSFSYVHLFPRTKENDKTRPVSSPLEINIEAGEIAYNINNNHEISGLLDSFYKNNRSFIYMDKINNLCTLNKYCKYKNICYLVNKYGLYKEKGKDK